MKFVQPALHVNQLLLQFLLSGRFFVNLIEDFVVLVEENFHLDQIFDAIIRLRVVIATVRSKQQFPLFCLENSSDRSSLRWRWRLREG